MALPQTPGVSNRIQRTAASGRVNTKAALEKRRRPAHVTELTECALAPGI
jgi:hypothetical protein